MLVTDPDRLADAERLLRAELAALDLACSRFRPDSEIETLLRGAGRWQRVGPLLADALAAALRAAELTDGLVDPTVGEAVIALGYDRDFAAVPREDPHPVPRAGAAPGWWRVLLSDHSGSVAHHDPERSGPGRRALVPRGVRLDLGATAKAFAADRAAALIAAACRCGALVSLGGDLSVAGEPPEGGWLVRVGEDHTRAGDLDPVVTIASGGLATSSVSRRSWRRGGRTLHHIVDPRTGDVAGPVWRAVTVAAGSCLDANAASTGAVVMGVGAPPWLSGLRLPARLVGIDGTVRTVAGWPGPVRG